VWTIPWEHLRERAQQSKQPSLDLVQLSIEGPSAWETLGDCYHDSLEEQLLYSWKSQPGRANSGGEIRFSFDIMADGELANATVVDGSGAPAEGAIRATLRHVSPFRALPPAIASVRVDATLRVSDPPKVLLPKVPDSAASKSARKEKPLAPRRRLKKLMDLFLPDGPETLDELRCICRGVAAAHGSLASVADVIANMKSKLPSADQATVETMFSAAARRFAENALEPMPPVGSDVDRSPDGAVRRARRRAREAGAFDLGLLFASTEAPASDTELETHSRELTQQIVRLEMMTDPPLPGVDTDPAEVLRELDDLEAKTEQTIVAIERRLKRFD
jgi:hypothetical protein